MEQDYTIYRTYVVTESDRGIRFVERIPLLNLVARPWIDLAARDWHTTSIEVRTATVMSAESAGLVDPAPVVTPRTPDRRSIVSQPHVIFQASQAITTAYQELPLAV